MTSIEPSPEKANADEPIQTQSSETAETLEQPQMFGKRSREERRRSTESERCTAKLQAAETQNLPTMAAMDLSFLENQPIVVISNAKCVVSGIQNTIIVNEHHHHYDHPEPQGIPSVKVPSVAGIISRRDDRVRDIIRKLMEDEISVVFVSGPPGMGKTVFAKKLYEVYKQEMRKQSVETTLTWIDIRDEITRLEDLFSILVDAVSQSASHFGHDECSRGTLLIKNMPRYHVLILDACEHVGSPLLSKFIQMVFNLNGELRLILTSPNTDVVRHCDRVYLESLQELTDIDAKEILKAIGSCPHNQSCKQSIVDKCHGLPQALVAVRTLVFSFDFDICELSKTLTKSITVEVLSDELKKERCLKTLYDKFLDRLRAKDSSSYFAALAVSMFGGPFTLNDFEAVTDVAECNDVKLTRRRRLLSTLRENSFIERCNAEKHESVRVRYEMHAVIKQYVQTLLATEDPNFHSRIASRFLLHYSKLLQSAFDDLSKSDQGVTYPIRDLPNIRVFFTMLANASEIEGSTSLKLPIIDKRTILEDEQIKESFLFAFGNEFVGQFLSLWCSHQQRLNAYECVIGIFSKSHIDVPEIRLEAARIKRGKERYDEALEDVNTIYMTCAERNDDIKASCLELMGSIKARRNPPKYDEAEHDLRLCMTILENTAIPQARKQAREGNKRDITRIAWRMASVSLKLIEVYINRSSKGKDDYFKARKMFDDGMAWFKEASPNKEKLFQARMHQRMSTLYQARGKYDRPRDLREHLETARTLLEEDGLTSHHLYGQVCHNLGRSFSESSPKNLDFATTLFENSIKVQEQSYMDQKPRKLALLYFDYGLTLLQRANELDLSQSCRQGFSKRAQDVIDKSIIIFETRPKDKLFLARALVSAGKASNLLDERHKARDNYIQALELWQSDELRRHRDATKYQKDCLSRLRDKLPK